MAITREDSDIDVLFSYIVMPKGMNGVQLAVEARRLRPKMKILLTSGYTAEVLPKDEELADKPELLPKPNCPEDLATKLRLVIGGS